MADCSRQILQKVSSFIQQQKLWDAAANDKDAVLYVGLSGGPDSVALLHILRELQVSREFQVSGELLPSLPTPHSPLLTPHSSLPTPHSSLLTPHSLIALHCNFHLRGEASDRDQRFCEQLCQKLGIELRIKEFDTRRYMQEHHLSLEMAARELRYDWWASLLTHHSSLIALGHHLDDSIETLLMNLMRGTGIQGLTGIVPYNAETHVIRPMLCLSRQEILAYLADNKLDYVTDATNAENDTIRNQVRNQLLPLMEQLLPQARQGITTTMQHLQESAELSDLAIEQFVSDHATRHCTDGYSFETLTSECPYPFQIQQYYLRRGYSFDGKTAIPSDQPLPKQPVHDESVKETFDQDKIHFPLQWRRWKKGDRMAPLGMNGHSKLLSDLFTDAHYLPIQKQLAWVLEDAEGQILWVPGLRMSHLARITSDTKKTITICYGEQP